MESIRKKAEVRSIIDDALRSFSPGNFEALSIELHETLLGSKVRFPLLEYAGEILWGSLKKADRKKLLDQISAGKSIGGNVIIGIFLQKDLKEDLDGSFSQAASYISRGAEWYVTDIIGERVFGVGLLDHFANAFPKFQRLKTNHDPWVIRAIGPGAHYATKKGLPKENVEPLFAFLLELKEAKEPNVRSGIGWAAKTVAKFHPDIIEQYQKEIFDDERTGSWFIRKVRIGLERNAYAKRNTG